MEFIYWLQQFRTPWLDLFFKFVNYFDRGEFFFVLIPTIWVCFGWRWGMRLYYILLLNSLTNLALKAIFLAPRPLQIDPSVGVVEVGGYSFPSGAAQTVILLSGILCTVWKSPWRWSVIIPYVALVSFSRIYLGAHFPVDILAGWGVGLLLFGVYKYAFPPIERALEQFRPSFLFALSLLVPLALIGWQPKAMAICIGGMGLGLGTYLCELLHCHLPRPKDWKQYVLRSAVAVAGAFCLGAFTWGAPLIGVWISFGCPRLFLKSGRANF